MTDEAVKTAAHRIADFSVYLKEAFGFFDSSIAKLVEAATPVIVAQALYESEHVNA